MRCAYCESEYEHRADIYAKCYRCRAEELYDELKQARDEKWRAHLLAAAAWGALAATAGYLIATGAL